MDTWLTVERRRIKSVGVDIGTTTSHLVFSELVLELSPFSRPGKYTVTERRILHTGKIHLTPLKSGNHEIDLTKLLPLLKQDYVEAGIKPDELGTGAVIITGESARKENAMEIIKALSSEAGRFVAATAGPNYESVISAHGSGAVALSKRLGCRLVHTDIGGGTSNIVVIDKGEILATGCVNIGGRQLAFTPELVLTRVEPAGENVLKDMGVPMKLGSKVTISIIDEVVKRFTDSLFEVLTGQEPGELTKSLYMTDVIPSSLLTDAFFSFSGGVSEYIYKKESNEYGDLGKKLGESIRARIQNLGLNLLEPGERIRATVLGASDYTLDVSGSTTYRTEKFTLPLKSVRVATPLIDKQVNDSAYVTEQIVKALQRTDIIQGSDPYVLAFDDPVNVQYARLLNFTHGIYDAVKPTIDSTTPIVLAFGSNVGNSVGNVLQREFNTSNILCIDELNLKEGDFIDIGEPIIGDSVYPVVIKSLVFNK